MLWQAEPVTAFGTAGLAAPQSGVSLQLVIFGFSNNVRYPDAREVPETVLVNPILRLLSEQLEDS